MAVGQNNDRCDESSSRGRAREGEVLVAKEPLVIIAGWRQRSPGKWIREAQDCIDAAEPMAVDSEAPRRD